MSNISVGDIVRIKETDNIDNVIKINRIKGITVYTCSNKVNYCEEDLEYYDTKKSTKSFVTEIDGSHNGIKDNTIDKLLGTIIKEFRLKLCSCSTADIAKALYISTRQYEAIENGNYFYYYKEVISVELLFRIAKILKVSIFDLIKPIDNLLIKERVLGL